MIQQPCPLLLKHFFSTLTFPFSGVGNFFHTYFQISCFKIGSPEQKVSLPRFELINLRSWPSYDLHTITTTRQCLHKYRTSSPSVHRNPKIATLTLLTINWKQTLSRVCFEMIKKRSLQHFFNQLSSLFSPERACLLLSKRTLLLEVLNRKTARVQVVEMSP